MPIVVSNRLCPVYNIDVVVCVDAAQSMRGSIGAIRERLLKYPEVIKGKMRKSWKSLGQLRIKLIVFKNYGCDKEPMLESPFFAVDEEDGERQFNYFVCGIEADGVGSVAGNGLEALTLAIKSDWEKQGDSKRHVVVIYSGGPVSAVGANAGASGYPDGMPASFAELRDMWEECMDRRAKRMLIFAPDTKPWSDMACWTNVFQTDVIGCEGYNEENESIAWDLAVNGG